MNADCPFTCWRPRSCSGAVEEHLSLSASWIFPVEYVRPLFEVTRYETDVCYTRHAAVPVIALSMGERGLPCRLLAPKFGAVLTFGALSAGRESAPGQPTVEQLRRLFRLPEQRNSTQARPPTKPRAF